MSTESLGPIDEDVRRTFERAWRDGQPRTIEDVLASVREPTLRPGTLLELVLIDLEFSWKRGSGTNITEYLSRFPELDTPQLRSRLEAEESDLRARHRDSPATEPAAPPNAGTSHIPGYEILGELGHGGMGIVYRARQVGLNRTVALKMIRAGSLAHDEDVRRFRAEAEAAARLQHPNVVQIHEVGEVAGQPYLALEFVAGGSLDRWLGGNPLDGSTAAQLVATIARAVHAAHEAGIVHRDLKPANILLDGTVPEGTRDLTGVTPKLTDFGLAKHLPSAEGETPLSPTQTGAILGTPSYMPPEQAGGKIHAIGPASDVYSLGAVLYELLTGRPPFRAPTPFDTLLQVLNQEPVPVRRLQPRVPLDLETICLKCLEKDPRRRYHSAAELAEDLERFLRGEPVRARPVSLATRAIKWAWRNPAWASLLAVSVLSLAILLTWGVIYNAQITHALAETQQAREQTEQALKAEQQQRRRAEANAYYHAISRADREWWANNVDLATRLLDECQTEPRGWEWGYLRRRCSSELLSLTARAPLALSRDGQRLAAGLSYGGREKAATFAIFNATTGDILQRLEGHAAGGVTTLAFSRDGKYLASGEGIGFNRMGQALAGEICVWETTTGKNIGRIPIRGTVVHLAFRADGQEMAAAIRGSFPPGGRSELLIAQPNGQIVQRTPHALEIQGIAYTTAGLLVARSPSNSVGMESPVNISDGHTGEVLTTLPHSGPLWQVGFSAGGEVVVLGGNPAGYVWNRTTGKRITTLTGHNGVMSCLDVADDGKWVASATGTFQTGEVIVWDAVTGQQVRYLRGHHSVLHVAFSEDGKRLASANASRVKLWDVTTGQAAHALPLVPGGAFLPRYSPDGRQIAYAAGKGEVRFWDVEAGKVVRTLAAHNNGISGLAYHPSGRRIATGGGVDRTVKLWDLETGTERALNGHWIQVTQVLFSPDGERLASASWDHTVRLWHGETGEPLSVLKGHRQDVACLAFSPDGKYLVSGGAGPGQPGEVFVWDVISGEKVAELPGNTNVVSGLAFHPSGRWLVTAGGDRVARVYDFPATGQEPRRIEHPAGVSSVAFLPDGRRMVTVAADGLGRVWDLDTGLLLLTLRGNRAGIGPISVCPTGPWLAAPGDGTLLLFRGGEQ